MLDKSVLKRNLLLLLIALFLAALGAFHYMYIDRETLVLDEKSRSRLGGSYIALSDGVTHYSLEGRENGRPVVLLHGEIVPMLTWDLLAPDLARSGFRVLRYDMFGRGLSDRPPGDYNRDFYMRQLKELLDALGIAGPVDLVGNSFGGSLAVAFAARYPGMVRKIVLISPILKGSGIRPLFTAPVLGELTARYTGVNDVEKRAVSAIRGGKLRDRIGPLRRQFQYRCFQRSFLSMLRSDALGDYTGELRVLGGRRKKVLVLWGTEDRTVTRQMITSVRRFVPDAEFHGLYGIGHGIVFDRPAELYIFINDFLRR